MKRLLRVPSSAYLRRWADLRVEFEETQDGRSWQSFLHSRDSHYEGH